MRVVIELADIAKIIKELDSCDDVPGVDSEAILDYVCGEYMSGNRCIERILADCVDGLCAVTDNDYCEAAYSKAVARLHRLIVTLYQILDEHRLKEHTTYQYANLRVVRNWRNLYVFELK